MYIKDDYLIGEGNNIELNNINPENSTTMKTDESIGDMVNTFKMSF